MHEPCLLVKVGSDVVAVCEPEGRYARRLERRRRQKDGRSDKLGRPLHRDRHGLAAMSIKIAHSMSESAREGLDLLKRGAPALKHGRAGKPHATIFTPPKTSRR